MFKTMNMQNKTKNKIYLLFHYPEITRELNSFAIINDTAVNIFTHNFLAESLVL